MRGPQGPQGPTGGSYMHFSQAAQNAATYFAAVFSEVGSNASILSVNKQVAVSAATLSMLRVNSYVSVNKDVSITVYVNGVATALTCTLANGTAKGSDLTHAVTLNQGDTVAFLISHTATAPPGAFFYITLRAV